MSLESFRDELLRFIASDTPEVLCIKGDWGVGKTFAWRHYLAEAQNEKNVKYDKYSYVSLFGRESLDDVRAAIVENTIDSRVVGNRPDIKSLDNVFGHLTTAVKDITRLTSFMPGSSGAVSSVHRALFLALDKQIVCLDDLERAGSRLETKSIMGLTQSLKEEKNCKVVLILNKEKLESDNAADFSKRFEKVTDLAVEFTPTPEEAADIGLDKEFEGYEVLTRAIAALDINNIRVIRRIQRVAIRLMEALGDCHKRIKEQAIITASIIVFSVLVPDRAPTIEDLKSKNRYQPATPNERYASYIDAFRSLGFNMMDEFDMIITDFVESGVLDAKSLLDRARELQAAIDAGDHRVALQLAWDKFHDSFENNDEDVLTGVASAIRANIAVATAGDLSAGVELLMEFGKEREAKELIKFYVDNKDGDYRLWNIPAYPPVSQVRSPLVKAAFAIKYQEMAPAADFEAILKSLGSNTSWSPDDLTALAKASSNDLVSIFKNNRGEELRKCLYGALKFRNIGNASEQMLIINDRVKDALHAIGESSPINRKRVENYLRE